MTKHGWGATSQEWDMFNEELGLTRDLLPVVSNPDAAISPDSKMKALGKTPSLFNKDGLVIGLANWTERETTHKLISNWKKETDLGICIQTRFLRALDVDVKDAATAERVMLFLQERYNFPIRFRADSSKFLMAFYVEGIIAKRVCKLDAERGGPMVEFLATGQQFIAAGTHAEGQRYQWDWRGLGDFPTLSTEEFEELWAELVATFGSEELGGNATRQKRVAGAVTVEDDVVKFIEQSEFFIGVARDGKVMMDCPWKDGHSTDNGDTQTIYMPPGDRDYKKGHFKCLHAGCASKKDGDFLEAIGFNDTMFTPEPPLVDKKGEPVEMRRFIENPSDWADIASQLLADKWRVKGKMALRHAQGDWYLYGDGRYVVQEAAAVSAAVFKYLDRALKYDKKLDDSVPFLPTRNKVNEALHALQALTLIPKAAAPMWISESKNAQDYVAVADGLLHVPTQKLTPHTPDFFNLTALPFAWAGSEGEPTEWLEFLETLWPGDEESKQTLQTIFGYLLTNDTSQQKMFLIKGPPRSGKGTIARVLGALLGEDNAVSTSFAQLAATPFGLESLLGKSLAFLPEARNTGGKHSNIQVAVERILSITGEDNVSVERKGQKAWQGKLPTRFFMMANEVPALGDSTEAFASRFIALKTTKSFLGQEDRGLTDRLLLELPQIMRWGLAGYELLREQGRFVAPVASEELMEDIADGNNHVRVFLKECCEVGIMEEAAKVEVYEAYQSWCMDMGRRPDAKNIFFNALYNANSQITASDTHRKGKRVFMVLGLRVKDCMFQELLD